MKQKVLYTLLALLLYSTLWGYEAQAQRLIPWQKGLTLSVGTPALDIREGGIFERDAFEVEAIFTQYLKRFNYYYVGASYTARNYFYRSYTLPTHRYLLSVGYAHPLLSDYTKTFLLYGGVGALGGYQQLHTTGNPHTFPNGGVLLDRSRWVYGGEALLMVDLFVTNSVVFQVKGAGRFLWNTDLELFYPSCSVGIKYNF